MVFLFFRLMFFLAPTPVINCVVQPPDFETREWVSATTDKPLLFYISGDGGFNTFSVDLCSRLNKQGYTVIALNSKKYFWNKKTPDQSKTAIENFLKQKTAGRNNKQIVIIGYSFGADVLPFILNRFTPDFCKNINSAILMAPSTSTDFEIHLMDFLGVNKKRDMDVINEINRVNNLKLIIISSEDDSAVNSAKITLKQYVHVKLAGGHHFDGDTDALTKVISAHTN